MAHQTDMEVLGLEGPRMIGLAFIVLTLGSAGLVAGQARVVQLAN